VLTATSPALPPAPQGGPKHHRTQPLAIAIPSSDGRPIVMTSLWSGDLRGVIAGAASEYELVPFCATRP